MTTTTTMTTMTTHPNPNDRVLVHIPLPAGMLGVNISGPVPQYESYNHVWVLDVTANSPLAAAAGDNGNANDKALVLPGDWIVSINECAVHGQGAGFCQGILAATAGSTTRHMVVLRSRTPQRFIYQEENTNTTTAVNHQAMTTTATMKNPPPPLQPSALSNMKAGDKPIAKKKQQQPKPQRKQAPLASTTTTRLSPVAPIRVLREPLQVEQLPVLGDTTRDMLYYRGALQLQGLKDTFAAHKESWETHKEQLESTITQLEARLVAAKRERESEREREREREQDAEHAPHGSLDQQPHGVLGTTRQHLPSPLPSPAPLVTTSSGWNTHRLACGNGLPLHVQQHLLSYIEGRQTRHLTCLAICNLRPDLFGVPGTKRRRAVQNKCQWFKKLKESDPVEYWRMVPIPDPSSRDNPGDKETACLDRESCLGETKQEPAAVARASCSSVDDAESARVA
jgi:hypothetical protein